MGRHCSSVLVCCAALLLAPAPAAADAWNERTVLKFSAQVMVPGATLEPGEYIFEIADPDTNRHAVRIRKQGSDEVITTQAVPVARPDTRGDVVVRFNPTESGPPAIKAWFYPGSTYGHEFVYPEEQARQIAERTKTVVLGMDVPGSDREQGVLRTYDPSGKRLEWKGDEAVIREWDAWRRSRQAQGAGDASAQERREAAAPAMRGGFQGTRVALDDLESTPSKYVGQRISVDAAVEEVFGPRLFTIDEPDWGDAEREILVLMPTELAAIVQEEDRVTVTGTLRPFVRTEVEREWGWLGLDPEVQLEISRQPILVADRLVGGNNEAAFAISPRTGGDRPVGTSGAAEAKPMSDAAALATATQDRVGDHVDLKGLRVAAVAGTEGFYVAAGGRQLLVVPAHPQTQNVTAGQQVSLRGVVLRLPDSMRERLKPSGQLNDEVYIFATEIAPAK